MCIKTLPLHVPLEYSGEVKTSLLQRWTSIHHCPVSRLVQEATCVSLKSASCHGRAGLPHGETWPTPVYTLGREVPPPSFPIGGLKKNAEIVIRSSQVGQLLLRWCEIHHLMSSEEIFTVQKLGQLDARHHWRKKNTTFVVLSCQYESALAAKRWIVPFSVGVSFPETWSRASERLPSSMSCESSHLRNKIWETLKVLWTDYKSCGLIS